MKLDKLTSLFFAVRVESRLRDALATCKPGVRRYFDGITDEYLRILWIDDGRDSERWLGKIVSPGPTLSQLEDAQRNLLSILRRIAPDIHVSASAIHVFVLHGVQGRIYVGDEPETQDDSDDELRRAG
jgi:hypothetical protein